MTSFNTFRHVMSRDVITIPGIGVSIVIPMASDEPKEKPPVSPRRTTPLITAVRNKDSLEVELLLQTGSDPNENAVGDATTVTPPFPAHLKNSCLALCSRLCAIRRTSTVHCIGHVDAKRSTLQGSCSTMEHLFSWRARCVAMGHRPVGMCACMTCDAISCD